MKKYLLDICAGLLCGLVCICFFLKLKPEEEPAVPDYADWDEDDKIAWVDSMLEERAQDPGQYLEQEYAQYVLHNVSFDEIPYTVSEEDCCASAFYSDKSETGPGSYWLSQCKAFDVEVRLSNEAVCRAYMKLLWHSLGQIGYGNDVPAEIISHPAQNVVVFRLRDYETWYKLWITPNHPVSMGLSVLEIVLDEQTGEFLHMHMN